MISITSHESVIVPTLEELNQQLQLVLDHLKYSERLLSVYFTNDEEIRVYNERYQGLAKPTDVLSWSYIEEDADSPYLGDIMISVETATRQAHDNQWELHTELARLLIHGIAHLVGYDHQTEEEEKEMLTLEIQLLSLLGLEHLYPAPQQ